MMMGEAVSADGSEDGWIEVQELRDPAPSAAPVRARAVEEARTWGPVAPFVPILYRGQRILSLSGVRPLSDAPLTPHPRSLPRCLIPGPFRCRLPDPPAPLPHLA